MSLRGISREVEKGLGARSQVGRTRSCATCSVRQKVGCRTWTLKNGVNRREGKDKEGKEICRGNDGGCCRGCMSTYQLGRVLEQPGRLLLLGTKKVRRTKKEEVQAGLTGYGKPGPFRSFEWEITLSILLNSERRECWDERGEKEGVRTRSTDLKTLQWGHPKHTHLPEIGRGYNIGGDGQGGREKKGR